MGAADSRDGTAYFTEAAVKPVFKRIQTHWSEAELFSLQERLHECCQTYSLDKVKFGNLLQLPAFQAGLVEDWFQQFCSERDSQIVDGLEFLSAAILLSSKVELVRKTCILFRLFDLDRSGVMRKDEFTIFLKAVSTGLHRTVQCMPPPPSVTELSTLSRDYFTSLNTQTLNERDLLTWVTEAHPALSYLSVLSNLNRMVFAWGMNTRRQLGLHLEPSIQAVPSPVLGLEGLSIVKVASSESHSLFLTSSGALWSCGAGFCGLLGHGDLHDRSLPSRIESLGHACIVDIACGVRHSAAISEKGQVFTWGNADLGQLGHNATEDPEVHQQATDPRTGAFFSYIALPTVVMQLFGKRMHAKQVSCCSFSTAVLTDQGCIFTWGNNTNGQCGHGQHCPDQRQMYLDPHMEMTAMQILDTPKHVEAGEVAFKVLTCGGDHMLAIDTSQRLWSWGHGRLGRLGHGGQQDVHEPQLVESLRHQVCKAAMAGNTHSICLLELYRLTVTGGTPFSLLALPLRRADRQVELRQPSTPPETSITLDAFASAPVIEVTFPHVWQQGAPYLDLTRHPAHDIHNSVVVFEKGLWPGTYLKLDNSDIDFVVTMSPDGEAISSKHVLQGRLTWLLYPGGDLSDCSGQICVFEALEGPPEVNADAVEAWQQANGPRLVKIAQQMAVSKARACIFVLPLGVSPFVLQAPSSDVAFELKGIPFGVMRHEHGKELMRASASGAPATLLDIREDSFPLRLEAVLVHQPKGIIVCQQSCQPQVQLLEFSAALVEKSGDVPIATVSFEAGQELRQVAQKCKAWLTMEVNPGCGVCSWGDSSKGQLGLGDIEEYFGRKSSSPSKDRVLAGKTSLFQDVPQYVSKLHELEVMDIACGSLHTVALTGQGEVFCWGSAVSLGAPMGSIGFCAEPFLVEQLQSTAKSTKVFAGYNQSFVLAKMPYQSIV